MNCPVTVFTGFLGAGKTTLILSLLKQLPKDYRVVLIKNEFGDVAVDSHLAQQQNINGVRELLNGCLCCTLVGQLKSAVVEVFERFRPDRILIETSGSAFPAPIAWQLRELEKERRELQLADNVHLDAIITVIDCLHFQGYEDTSYTAKMQAQYTDLILMNKWEALSERDYDLVLDHVYTLNPDTPKFKVSQELGMDPQLLFGLDSRLFQLEDRDAWQESQDTSHMQNEVDVVRFQKERLLQGGLNRKLVEAFLGDARLDKETFYRIKGFLWMMAQADSNSESELVILNFAFGRYAFSEPIKDSELRDRFHGHLFDLTVMGVDLKDAACCSAPASCDHQAKPKAWIQSLFMDALAPESVPSDGAGPRGL